MARSSHGSRRATTWAVERKPKTMPRVVRLGRPANDNPRRTSLAAGLCIVVLTMALTMLMLVYWRLI